MPFYPFREGASPTKGLGLPGQTWAIFLDFDYEGREQLSAYASLYRALQWDLEKLGFDEIAWMHGGLWWSTHGLTEDACREAIAIAREAATACGLRVTAAQLVQLSATDIAPCTAAEDRL